MKKNLINILLIILLIFLAAPLTFPFLRNGFFTTHDGEWAVIRLVAYNFALKDGQLPPRWAGNLYHSYGYPVLNFNYPLPPIIGEFFHLSGLNFVWSIKAVFVLSIILSAIFIYLFLSEIFGRTSGILGIVLYLYYPFRMVDLFVRGSVGESLSFACLPLVYWSIVKLRKNKNIKWIVVSSTSLALLILSHNSIALASLPFVVIFMIVSSVIPAQAGIYKNRFYLYRFRVKPGMTKYAILTLLLALTLSCFFWLPALYEKQWTILRPEIITKPTDHFPTLTQLIIPSWGYGQSKLSDSLSFQIGPIHLILFLLSLFLLLFKKKEKIYSRLPYFFLFASFLNIFFLLPISTFFWRKLPLMAFISYPWRILVPIGFYFTVIGASVLNQIKNNRLKNFIVFIIFIILFFMTKDYRRPINYINRDEMFYITNESTTIEGDENTPIWVKTPPKEAPLQKIEVDGEYKIEKQKSNLLEFSLNVTKSQKVIVNTLYYPGWQLFINGKLQKIDFSNEKGVISFNVPEGQSFVELRFGETPLRYAADFISLAAILTIIFLLFKNFPK